MPLAGGAREATPDVFGFDFDARPGDQPFPMTPALARAFRDHGYDFCVRYVPRRADPPSTTYDLKAQQADMLLDAGLALLAVQHFEGEGWKPSEALGTEYGDHAAEWALERIGFVGDVTIFCDIEGVAITTPEQRVIDYCHAWHASVLAAGFRPGAYLGSNARIPDGEVTSVLPFEHYWAAFNETFAIPGRGLQMKQLAVGAKSPLRPKAAAGFRFQADRLQRDQADQIVRWFSRA